MPAIAHSVFKQPQTAMGKYGGKLMRKTLLAVLLAILYAAPQSADCANKVVVVPLGKSKQSGPGLVANSIGMTFNLLPAGTFVMGSGPGEPGRDTDEAAHTVTLTKAFYLQITEVTNKQWNEVIVANGLGINPSVNTTGDNYPVNRVNWFEAMLFANTLSSMEGRSPCYNTNSSCSGVIGDEVIGGDPYYCSDVDYVPRCTGYHLPTEAQWEYGARAGTSTPWYYLISYDMSTTGQAIAGYNSNVDPIAWYSSNNTSMGTKPVGWKQRNSWFLFDMLGNVWEWCQDWYHSDYYTMPGSDIDPLGPVTAFKVIRGGSFGNEPQYLRAAERIQLGPAGRGEFLGFRLAVAAQ
jgi:formylglycine-generating enzyme required for sulfatase activity